METTQKENYEILKNLFEVDEELGMIRFIPKIKQLETGFIKYYFLKSSEYLIRIKVLEGFKHKFLDSVEIYDDNFRLFKKIYRIREVRFDKESVKTYVEEQLLTIVTQENDIEVIKSDSTKLFSQTALDLITLMYSISNDQKNSEHYLQFHKHENY